jgi:hypothetical protein
MENNVSGTKNASVAFDAAPKKPKSIVSDSDLACAVRDSLAGLTPEMEDLNLRGTQVSDLGPLAGLKSLRCLRIKGTQVRDISVVQDLPALEMLDLDYAILQDAKQWAILDAMNWLVCVNRKQWEESLPTRDPGETVRLRRKTPMVHMCDGPLRIGTMDECGLKTTLDVFIAFVESIPLDDLDSYDYGHFEESLKEVSNGEFLLLPIREAREIVTGLSKKYGFREVWNHIDDMTEQDQVCAMLSVDFDECWRLSHESGGRIWESNLESGLLLRMLKRLRTLREEQG